MQTLVDDLVIALDPVEFARGRLGFDPDPWQAKFLRSRADKMILRCSRQSGKSTTTAILALHSALYQPGSLALLFSASLRQSRELFRKVKDFLQTYSETGENPARMVEDNKLEMRLDNGSRIVSLPAKEQTIRGFSSVDLLIEDEASRVEDEVYYAIRPMLAVSGGRLILLSTPWGKRGHFFREWEGPDFEKYHIPATECPRISPEFLAQEKRQLGDYWYKQEYDCEFLDLVGSVFTHEEIQQAINRDRPMLDL